MPTGDIERLARAICGQDDDPLLFAAAVAIAENHFVRRAIAEQQLAVIERLRDNTAIALAKGGQQFHLGQGKTARGLARQPGNRGERSKTTRKIQ